MALPTRRDYASNCRAFIAELDALDRDIRAILAQSAGKPFLVFHPSWGYFAQDYGLRQIAIEAEGKELPLSPIVRSIRLPS